ncbi:phospholipase D-like domain-containing protein [Burkholderia sp. Ac-20365]|uniref:phospholipase D-like domain-containing protein n=1 Tax=Burkholderia sp. Ac-20365 TaxID=2703897 RepID=UPI00197BBD55|nr:hypothetical protein [Burkholderia sp. Ac-20365]
MFSPYVTSKTAETVLGDGMSVDLHLLFEAEQFASGASSLNALRRLLDAGHRIFHVAELHAKIFLVPGKYLSIGSQNLTRSGTVRREMTVTTDSPDAATAAVELVGPWVLERTPVTREMIDEMQVRIGPLAQLFDTARKQAAAAQEGFLAAMEVKERERQAESERQRQRGLHHRLAELGASLLARRQSVTGAVGVVTRMDRGNGRCSLVVRDDVDLTSWVVGAKTYKLKDFHRYLCVLEDIGSLGWARVVRSRITFIQPGLDRRPVKIEGERFRLVFDCSRTSGDGNVIIEVFDVTGSVLLCAVDAWYSPGNLEIISVLPSAEPRRAWSPFNKSADPERMANWIRGNLGAFRHLVMPEFTEPFQYGRGNADGPEADRFFGPVNTRIRLRVVLENDVPVLVATRL